MKYVKLFEEFNDVDIETLHEEIEILDEGAVKQVLGWVFFPVFSLANVIFQITQKKKKIKGMIADETNPKKKQILKDKLEALSYEEVAAKKKAKDQKEDLADKAAAAKKAMTPKEKKQLAKETANMQKKLDKAKEKLRKLKQSDTGSGFV
jgi:ATP-dependent exoDNAse (exonuclease V) beta subunit